MADLLIPTRKNGLYRDPLFGLARDLFKFDAPQAKKAAFAPSFDVEETEAAYILRADLPGVAEDAVEVTLDGRLLTIAGSREAEEKTDSGNYHVYERRFGSFTRKFTLPIEANGEDVGAALKDGVLTVTVAKKPEAKAKKISINKR